MNRKSFLLAASFIMILLQGCSTIKTNELTIDESSVLQDKSVTITRYSEKPSFMAQTPVNVQFGMLGIATAISNGNAMIEDNEIADPAVDIAEKLAQGLQDNYSMKFSHNDSVYTDTNEIPALLEKHSEYDFILDVRTVNWNSIYFPSDWDSYRVFYTAHARLIDTQSGAVVAEELCQHIPEYEDTNLAPSYKDLENGDGLREELGKSVTYCVDRIQTMAKLKSVVTTEQKVTAN